MASASKACQAGTDNQYVRTRGHSAGFSLRLSEQLQFDPYQVWSGVNIVRHSGRLMQERVIVSDWKLSRWNELRGGRKLEIIRPVGDQPVAKCRFDPIILQQERSRHTLHIASGKPGKIAIKPGH